MRSRLILAMAVGVAPCLSASTPSAAALRQVAAESGKRVRYAQNGEVRLAFQVYGPAHGRPILLIAGTGQQFVDWPLALIHELVRNKHRVIVFDNRDAGASTHFIRYGLPDFAKVFGAAARGENTGMPYRAEDLADDAAAVMTAAGAQRADVLGVSGGATIASLLALAHPDRVLSLTLVMANSGNPSLPLPADPGRMASVPPPAAGSLEQLAAVRAGTERTLANNDAGFDYRDALSRAKIAVARDGDAFGVIRQGVSLLLLGDIRSRLGAIKVPTVVIHGSADPLISVRAGREVADSIPNATFVLIDGMGHSLPATALPRIASAVALVSTKGSQDPDR